MLVAVVSLAGGIGATTATLVVTAIGAFATWIPSRRALKIDPAILLRTT